MAVREWEAIIELHGTSVLMDLQIDPQSVEPLVAAQLLAALHPCPPIWQDRQLSKTVVAINLSPELPIDSSRRRLIERIVESLGQEACEQFLRDVLPDASGSFEHCFLEWMISQEWAERISRPLAPYLGYSGVRDIAEQFGIAATGRPDDLLTEVCSKIGIPRIPLFPGPQSSLQDTAVKAANLCEDADVPIDTLKRHVLDCSTSLESILKQVIWLYATVFDSWYAARVKTKLGSGELRTIIDAADIGHLASCIGSLRKHGAGGGKHAREVSETLGKPLKLERLETHIDRIRVGRRFAAHDKTEVDESEQRDALRDVLQAYVDIWEERELVEITPYIVMVRATRQTAWGKHAEVMDEFGRDFSVFLVDLDDQAIGNTFFILPRSNPIPVAPLMVQKDKVRNTQRCGNSSTNS